MKDSILKINVQSKTSLLGTEFYRNQKIKWDPRRLNEINSRALHNHHRYHIMSSQFLWTKKKKRNRDPLSFLKHIYFIFISFTTH